MDPITRPVPVTITGTLRRAEPARPFHWPLLGALMMLLILRATAYYYIGPAVSWTPRVNLYFVTLVFRGDRFEQLFLFSALSYLRVWFVFYCWLLFLALTSRRVAEPDSIHKSILLQLGRVGHWPRALQAILPLAAVTATWVVVHPLLVQCGVINPAKSPLHLVEQGLLVGAAAYFSLKYLIPPILILHLITSYVYLGDNPVWSFVSNSTRNIIAPLNRVPLRAGKIDFAPVLGVAIVLLVLHLLPEQARLRWGLPAWPQ